MEQTIRRIIEIDKLAEEYRKGSDKSIDNLKKELSQKLKDMEATTLKEIENERENIMDKKISEAKEIAKKIDSEREREILRIKESYEKNKRRIAEEIFDGVINNLEEE